VREIHPGKLQLNSLDRPGTEDWVAPADFVRMEEIRAFFQGGLDIPVEIISRCSKEAFITEPENEILSKLIDLITPQAHTKAELSTMLHIHVNEVSKLSSTWKTGIA